MEVVSPWDNLLNRWQRREAPVYAALPYLLLAVSVLLSVLSRTRWDGELAGDLVLSGAALGWQLALVGPFAPWRRNRRVRAGFYLGLLVLLAALVVRAPWFGFFVFSGYLYLRLLPSGRWVAAGLVATAVIMGTSQYGGVPGGALSDWAV